MLPEISVVVPMRNESPNVEGVYTELTTVLVAFGRPYEMLVIADGSQPINGPASILKREEHRIGRNCVSRMNQHRTYR